MDMNKLDAEIKRMESKIRHIQRKAVNEKIKRVRDAEKYKKDFREMDELMQRLDTDVKGLKEKGKKDESL